MRGSEQGSSLQGLVKIGSPTQGFPSGDFGGLHRLCMVWVPPPHFRVQDDQS